MPEKDFWKSKTFWFNVVALAIMVINPFGFENHIPNDKLAEYAAAIITALNIVLRFTTKQPVTLISRR